MLNAITHTQMSENLTVANALIIRGVLEECYNFAAGNPVLQANIEASRLLIERGAQVVETCGETADIASEQLLGAALAVSRSETDLLRHADPLHADLSGVPVYTEQVQLKAQDYINGRHHAKTVEYAREQQVKYAGKIQAKQAERIKLLQVAVRHRVSYDAWKLYAVEMERRAQEAGRAQEAKRDYERRLRGLQDERKMERARALMEAATGRECQPSVSGGGQRMLGGGGEQRMLGGGGQKMGGASLEFSFDSIDIREDEERSGDDEEYERGPLPPPPQPPQVPPPPEPTDSDSEVRCLSFWFLVCVSVVDVVMCLG